MKTRSKSRPVDALNLLLKERQTTAPPLEGDSARTGKGSPAEPVETLLTWLTKLPSLGLFLISHLIDQQRFEDATGWWPGAKDYLERVARMMGLLQTELPKEASFLERLPFQGSDLLYRLGRIKLMEMLVERLDSFLGQCKNTLLVERADVMRMADTVMTEVEMLLGRPTFTGPARQTLSDLAQIPLSTWEKWLASIAETSRKNDKLRTERQGEIDTANRAAAAARATARIASGQPPSEQDVLAAAELTASRPMPPLVPPRTSRTRPR